MYNPQLISVRIKESCTGKNISISKMLSDCGIGKNTIARLNAGYDITLGNAFKIAEYLDLSIDYLLGRTNNPEINTR